MAWDADRWMSRLFRSRLTKSGFLERAAWPLLWRRAYLDEWPQVAVGQKDYEWSRHMGTGFVTEFGEEILFLIDRDWIGWPDAPQWGLASFYPARRKWALWGNFSDLPEAWTVPSPLYGPADFRDAW